MDLPDLLEIQTKSYARFLQADTPPRLRKKSGLNAVFMSLFPVNESRAIIRWNMMLQSSACRKNTPT